MKLDSVPTVHIGVDVSKAKLDIFVPATKEGVRPTTEQVDNTIEGFRKLRDIARKADAVVCVEPTGGYELDLPSLPVGNSKIVFSPKPASGKRMWAWAGTRF